MAEREGFEPSVPFPAHILSRDAQSATLSPLLGKALNKFAPRNRSIEIEILLRKNAKKRLLTSIWSDPSFPNEFNTNLLHLITMKTTFASILFSLASVSLSTASTDTTASEKTPESPFNTVGMRIGFDSDTKVSLTSYELYETSDPQWSWDLSESMTTGIGYEAAIGALAGEGEVSAYIHFGFTLEFAHDALPVTLVLATGPSLYSEDTFEDFDLGGNVQFTSSAGLNWQVCDGWAVEYRYQHTSNAGLESHNPGLNMHAFALSHNF